MAVAPTFCSNPEFNNAWQFRLTQLTLMPEGLYMFKNPFKRSKSMAAEQNEQEQDIGQAQADQQTGQT